MDIEYKRTVRVGLELEVAAVREAAERAALELLAADPRDLRALVPAMARLAGAHSAASGMPVEDVLDTYACVAGNAANRRLAGIDT